MQSKGLDASLLERAVACRPPRHWELGPRRTAGLAAGADCPWPPGSELVVAGGAHSWHVVGLGLRLPDSPHPQEGCFRCCGPAARHRVPAGLYPTSRWSLIAFACVLSPFPNNLGSENTQGSQPQGHRTPEQRRGDLS